MSKNYSKTRSSRRNRSRLSFFLICFLIITVIVGVIIFVVTQLNQPEPIPESPVTPETPVIEEESSSSGLKPDNNPDDDIPNDKAPAYEGENINTLDVLTGSVAYKGITNDTLEVAVMINQYLENPGTCRLNLYNSDNESVLSADVEALADVTTSVCNPFIVSVANLPAGKYTIKVTLKGDQKTGEVIDEVIIE